MTPTDTETLQALWTTAPWDWPENAAQLILEVLSDPSRPEAERLEAAELAAESVVAGEDVANALIAVATTQGLAEPLRAQAAISLGPALEEAVEPPLEYEGYEDEKDLSEETYLKIQSQLQALHANAAEPDVVRRAALEASVRGPLEWHAEAVREAYASDDLSWRTTAVFCMRFVQGFEDLILESLASDVPPLVYEAVVAAGNWGIDAAWNKVQAILQTKDDKELLLAAIESAASIRPEEALPLLEELTDSDDEEIASAAEEALVTMEPQDEADDL